MRSHEALLLRFLLIRVAQTLLARNYRGDIPMSAVEKFPVLLSEAEEESSAVPPCFSHEGINVRPWLSLKCHASLADSNIVSLHPTQQPLPPCLDETKHECRRDPAVLT